MEIKVLNETENPYLDRRELEIKIIHDKNATPKRVEVFKTIVERFTLDPEKMILMSLRTLRGTNKSIALIYYYPDGIDWSTIEPVKRSKVIKIGEEKSKEEGEET